MANPYKLTEEIKQFIITEKKVNSRVSCRGLIPLIEEKFQVKLSKSLVNNVIKQANLSNPVGRRREKEPIIVKQPEVTQINRKEKGLIENGGCFFLKAADIELSLTATLAKQFSGYFPDLSWENLQKINEALIFIPLFKNKESLCLFIGRELSNDRLTQYLQQLTQIPFSELKEPLMKLGINYNINEIKELYRQCLLRLNSYAQANFFPSGYQFLDFSAMQERFYCLFAKIEKMPEYLGINLFYPAGFAWAKDILWQEDLAYAANRVNESSIFTPEKEQIWINPQPLFFDEKAFSFI